MNSLKPPTDNLYKFMSIFGLILFIFGIYTYKTTDFNLRKDIYHFDSEKKNISVNPNLDSIAKSNKLISKQATEKELKYRLKQYPRDMASLIIIAIAGLALGIVGFRLWYLKTQKFQDKIIERTADEFNKNQIIVHELQFAKEFEIYQVLWEELAVLKFLLKNLVYKTEKTDFKNDIKYSLEWDKSLEKFNNSYNKCYSIIVRNTPFYSEDINNEIKSIFKKMNEIRFVLLDEEFMSEKKIKGAIILIKDKLTVEIEDSIDKICNHIKNRIGLIKIK
ncbi:hypothetical protein [Tenacibaculum dicentrarchi]|uniref:hypothetical protein n=1 Tax=Tenacibaculum dicentrarchi TaxID=669041 RepID=UPI0035156D26